MYFIINVIGILLVLGLSLLLSFNKKQIAFKPIIILFVIQLATTWFMLSTDIGGKVITLISDFFLWLINSSMTGINFVFGNFAPLDGSAFTLFMNVLMPIIFVVVFFDILTYFGILPAIINGVGWIFSKIAKTPRFESFYAIQVMFLGNNEALAVTRDQLNRMDDKRLLTVSMISMSCVSAGMLGGYLQILDPKYVLIAIPLNAIGTLIITSLINPYTVTKEEDIVYSPPKSEKGNFFDMISTSMLTGGKLALIIAVMLIGFVSLITAANTFLGLIHDQLTLENIFGVIFSPISFFMGVEVSQIFTIGQLMGVKIVLNEFVAMTNLSTIISSLNAHTEAVISTFLVSFCNFATIGIILGTMKSLFGDKKTKFIADHTWLLLVSGILVSSLTAMVVGLFVW
ncbi:NupC/NupG family nucleoside CNT transporter [Metabacillus litoralis]|jgi:purine nucleoside transport protein|uniref:NupC/NupG family nucleoside CNT transporter n=1 Tax=Metabacillus litoralis TaxID=152268 RepID=UPI00203D3186|nr:nucleoside transporter C-terminal domain-containing protein [Metabacillus litoralis]MCM3651645.1 NupC/NupG family nucleoside CNT transporter [Metabacillus litoralis]